MEIENPIKLLELTERVLSAQLEELSALHVRLNILENADINDFVDNDAPKFKQTADYATTEKTIAIINCKKRIINLEGEIEGAKMTISELNDTITGKKNDE